MVQHADIDHTGIPGVGGSSTAELLGSIGYRPGTNISVASTSSATIADASGSLTVTFTAPASGNVLVRLTAYAALSAAGAARWGIRESTTTVVEGVVLGVAHEGAVSTAWKVTGVTAGSHTYKWAFRTSAGTHDIFGGPAYGDCVMEVWAA